MTDLEKELLDDSSKIFTKLQEIEEAEMEGSSSIHKAALAKEFFWEKSYRVNVTSAPSYERSGSLEVNSLQEALGYKKGEDSIYSYDVEWEEDAEDCFEEIVVDDIEVSVGDFTLKNPSKEYQELLNSQKRDETREEIIGALKRCLISSGANPDEFQIFISEVFEKDNDLKETLKERL